MPFNHFRTVRLADTDAAGVMFFARTLAVCHEAYEESLAAAGVPLAEFLGDEDIVLPISRSEANYLRPLRFGEKLRVSVEPRALTEQSFAVDFEIVKLGVVEKLAARVRTEHVATSVRHRARVPLPPAWAAWVQRG